MRIYTTGNQNLRQILHCSQPLPRFINLSYPLVHILPEGGEFLVKLDGFGCVVLLFVYLTEHEEGFGVYIFIIGAKVLRRSWYNTLQMAEVAISKEIFAEILFRINRSQCCSQHEHILSYMRLTTQGDHIGTLFATQNREYMFKQIKSIFIY